MSKRIPPGYRLIFRASIRIGDEKLYARDFGLRGFPLVVPIRKK